jgi:hypothetical protein
VVAIFFASNSQPSPAAADTRYSGMFWNLKMYWFGLSWVRESVSVINSYMIF